MSVAEKVLQLKQDFDDVYEAGKAAGNGGYEQGFADGELAGKQAEYDAFWDEYQQNGNKTNYQYAFSGTYWNDKTFKPKYDIVLGLGSSGYLMFSNSKITDLEKALGGKKLDVCFGGSSIFNSAGEMTVIPEITANGMNSWFRGCGSLVTIRKIILGDNATDFYNSFLNCSKLTNITFEGVIGGAISFANSPLLSDESINNIIGCLKDLTGQTTQTLDFHSDIVVKLTDEQNLQILSKNWSVT